MKRSRAAVTVLWSVIAGGCATPPPQHRPPPAPAAAPMPATSGAGIREVPHNTAPNDRPWFPPSALQRHLSGRVLVEFQIAPPGKAIAPSVAAADADPLLQKAALDLVSAMRFDLSDPRYDAADPRPFYISVLFCIQSCGDLKAYAGKGREEIVITVR
jgi:TonB family protein